MPLQRRSTVIRLSEAKHEAIPDCGRSARRQGLWPTATRIRDTTTHSLDRAFGVEVDIDRLFVHTLRDLEERAVSTDE
jgi:hypothetical protein